MSKFFYNRATTRNCAKKPFYCDGVQILTTHTWEVWRTLKKLELLLATPRATLTHFSCSPNFARASITQYTHAKHEKILKLLIYLSAKNELTNTICYHV